MKWLSRLALAGLVASLLTVGAGTMTPVGACTWSVYHASPFVYDSYWNPAIGQTAYIRFEVYTQYDGCGTSVAVVNVLATDGYAMSSGTVITRDWLSGSYWGSKGCAAGGHSSVNCYGVYMYGGGTPSGDDYQTTVHDAFGGVHSRYVSVN